MSSGTEPEFLRKSSGWVLGEWTVLPQSHELLHESGRRLRVEARAMRVLQMLCERAGEVVSPEEMLQRIWEGKVVTPHSVASVISDLRKALGTHASGVRYIETIPKRGYRLVIRQPQGSIPAGVGDQHPGGADHASAASAVSAPLGLRRSGTSRAWRLSGVAVALSAALALLLWLGRVDSHGGLTRSVDSTVAAQYLRARQLWSRREHEAVVEARRILLDVLARDDSYAPAHAALADIYAHKTGDDLGLPELETFREAQRHLDRARALDPSLPEAHVTQALLDFYRDLQPRKALTTVGLALSMDPQFAYAWQTRSMLLSAVGEHEPSVAAIRRARALDPASASIGWDEVWFLYLAGQVEQARAAFAREAHKSQPNNLYGALIEQAGGNAKEAMRFWLQRLRARGAQLPEPALVQSLADAESPAAAYQELLRQVRGIAGYEESPVVLAIWLQLAGDPQAAAAALATVTPGRRHWLALWVTEMPVFAAPARAS